MQTQQQDEIDLDDRMLVDLTRFRIGTGQKLEKVHSNQSEYDKLWRLRYTPPTDALTSFTKYVKLLAGADVTETTDEMFPDEAVMKHEKLPFSVPGVPDDAVVILSNAQGDAPMLEWAAGEEGLDAQKIKELSRKLKEEKSKNRRNTAQKRANDASKRAADVSESPDDEDVDHRSTTEDRIESAKSKKSGGENKA